MTCKACLNHCEAIQVAVEMMQENTMSTMAQPQPALVTACGIKRMPVAMKALKVPQLEKIVGCHAGLVKALFSELTRHFFRNSSKIFQGSEPHRPSRKMAS